MAICPPKGNYQLTAYSQLMTSSIHQALSKWHLYNGLLHGVEGTQLTFVGFRTHFHHLGIFYHYHHLVPGSIGPLKR